MMAFSGVRSSWLMLARNWLLARFGPRPGPGGVRLGPGRLLGHLGRRHVAHHAGPDRAPVGQPVGPGGRRHPPHLARGGVAEPPLPPPRAQRGPDSGPPRPERRRVVGRDQPDHRLGVGPDGPGGQAEQVPRPVADVRVRRLPSGRIRYWNTTPGRLAVIRANRAWPSAIVRSTWWRVAAAASDGSSPPPVDPRPRRRTDTPTATAQPAAATAHGTAADAGGAAANRRRRAGSVIRQPAMGRWPRGEYGRTRAVRRGVGDVPAGRTLHSYQVPPTGDSCVVAARPVRRHSDPGPEPHTRIRWTVSQGPPRRGPPAGLSANAAPSTGPRIGTAHGPSNQAAPPSLNGVGIAPPRGSAQRGGPNPMNGSRARSQNGARVVVRSASAHPAGVVEPAGDGGGQAAGSAKRSAHGGGVGRRHGQEEAVAGEGRQPPPAGRRRAGRAGRPGRG